MARPTKIQNYLKIAKTVSERSTCMRRHYGAIIVSDDGVISTGYNGSARGEENCCDEGKCERMEQNIPHGEKYELCKSLHSEMNAIVEAGRHRCKGATLYLYGEDAATGETEEDMHPCKICMRLIKNVGIKKVIIGSPERYRVLDYNSARRSFM